MEILEAMAGLLGIFLACLILDPYYRRYKAWVDNKFKETKDVRTKS